MTVFSGLVRRAALEAERRLRAGVDLLAAIADDPDRTADLRREREERAEQEARIRRLEEMVERVLEGHDRDLGALRTDLDALITQLNDRLLPRIDERMDDTERDLTALATGLVRSGREAAATRSRLETLENRVGDLRDRIVRMEQRAGLWRDLQATMARLGDDIDALRTRINVRAAHAPQAAPTPQPATSAVTPAAAAASPVAERLGEGGPQQLSSPDAHSQAS